MRLVLLTFGDRLAIHYQASFAVLTFLRSPVVGGVSVVTDRPEYYRYFGDRVSLIATDAGRLKAWRGEHDFFWRVKMCAIEAVVRTHPGEHVLYVDSDTFLAGDLASLEQDLAAGHSCMHEREGRLSALATKTERSMWRCLAGRRFGPVQVTRESELWNAGVVGLPATTASALVALAIELCDAMCATPCTRRLLEQFAFSLALQHATALRPANGVIGHYWGNKAGWNAKIAEFFLYSQLAGTSFDEDLARVGTIDLGAVPTILKQRNARLRLMRLLDRLMPPKQVRYLRRS